MFTMCLKAASKSYNESFSDDRNTTPNRHCALRLFLVVKTFDFSVDTSQIMTKQTNFRVYSTI